MRFGTFAGAGTGATSYRPFDFLQSATPDWSSFSTAARPTSLGSDRPFSEVGKFGLNPVETWRPTMLDKPEQEQQPSIIGSFLRGAAETITTPLGSGVQKAAGDIGYGIGDVVLDIPGDIVSRIPNIPFLPGGGMSGLGYLADLSDTERLELEQQMREAAPWDQMTVLGRYAQARYDKEVEEGKIDTSILAPFARPTVSLGEQMMTTMLAFAVPGMAVERTFVGATDRASQIAEYDGEDTLLKDLAKRYNDGDFGTGQKARDRLMDELVLNGRGYSNDWAHSLLGSIALDPLILLSAGAGKIASAGGKGLELLTQNGKFLSTFPEAERLAVHNKVIERAAAALGVDSTEAQFRLAAQPVLNQRFMLEVAQEYPQHLAEAKRSLSYMQRFGVKWEPALRPVFNIVRRMNDPLTMFGSSPTSKALNGYLSDAVTEGVARAHGLDNVVDVLDAARNVSPALRGALEEGLGVYTGNLTRLWGLHRVTRGLRDTLKMSGGGEVTPDRWTADFLAEVRGRDIAHQVEMYARRVKPQYLAAGPGPEHAGAVMDTARAATRKRLKIMDPSLTDAQLDSLTTKMNRDQMAFVDASFYGWSVKQLKGSQRTARGGYQAGKQGAIDAAKAENEAKRAAADALAEADRIAKEADRLLKRALDKHRRLAASASATDEAKDAAKADVDKLTLDAASANADAAKAKAASEAADAAAKEASDRVLIDPDSVTIIGERELTEQRAQLVLDAIRDGDEAFVRHAVDTYDFLFLNLSDISLDYPALAKRVKSLIEPHIPGPDQTQHSLVRELTPSDVATHLSPEVQDWYNKVHDMGYSLGMKPDENYRWRAIYEEDGVTVAGLNPWLDATDEAASVRSWSVQDAQQDRLFHAVRGDRIVLEARQRFIRSGVERYGLTQTEATGLFSRLIKAASEQGITPRGMSGDQIYTLSMSHHIGSAVKGRMTDRDAAALLLDAFSGDLWTVGATQKFTGALKTATGGGHNYLGQMTERVYPLIRFTLNPIFQMQELLEPFVLNIARGIRPGLKPSEMDSMTERLIKHLMQNGKYALDDQIEFGDLLLYGSIMSKEGFGPITPLMRALDRLPMPDIKRIKYVNYLRAQRRFFGEEAYGVFKRVAPQQWDEWASFVTERYGLTSRGDIGVRWLAQQSFLASATPEVIRSAIRAMKPEDFGARTVINLDEVAGLLRQIGPDEFAALTDGEALRQTVSSGAVDSIRVRDALTGFGADPVYAERAARTASLGYTVDEWFDNYANVFAGGSKTRTNLTRALWQAIADAQGITLQEYLARKSLRSFPMSADAETFANLSPRDMAALRFHVDVQHTMGDLNDPMVMAFRRQFVSFPDEEAWIVTPDGRLLHDVPGLTRAQAQAKGYEGGVEFIRAEKESMRGNRVFHNHPYNPGEIGHSSNDLLMAIQQGVIEMRAESQTYSFVIRPIGGVWPKELVDLVHTGKPGTQRITDELQQFYREARHEVIDREQISNIGIVTTAHPEGTRLYREAWHQAHERMAAKYGYEYRAIRTPFIDPAAAERYINDVASDPPDWLRVWAPDEAKAAPLELVEAVLPDGRVFKAWLPGGFDHAPSRYTYWEQAILKMQGINPQDFWDANPVEYLNMMKRSWRAKEKDPRDPYNVINSMMFAALTPGTELAQTEALWSRIRGVVTTRNGVTNRMASFNDLMDDADTFRQTLQQHGFYDDVPSPDRIAQEMGLMFQMKRGYLRSALKEVRNNQSAAIRPDRNDEVAVVIARADEEVRALVDGGMPLPEAIRTVEKRVNSEGRLKGMLSRDVSFVGRAYAPTMNGGTGFWMLTVPGNMKTLRTSKQWGYIHYWASETLPNFRMQRWVARQPWETASQHGFRLASMFPGLAAKTGMMAMDVMGPGALDKGVLDTVIIGVIAREADALGIFDQMLAGTSQRFQTQMRDSIAKVRASVTDKIAFPSPGGLKVTLLSGARKRYAEDPAGTVARMKAKLVRAIPDPEERAFWDDEDVLTSIALNSDGSIIRYGGDYEIMDRALTAMKLREAEALGWQPLGTNIAFEFDPGTGSRNAATFGWVGEIEDENARRAVMEGFETHLRPMVEEATGVRITRAIHGEGGWLNPETGEFSANVNTVWSMTGERDQIERAMNILGYLAEQTSILGSRAKPGLRVSTKSSGEAWAFDVVAPRALNDAEVTEFGRLVAQAVPHVASWGSHSVELDNGRHAVRFIFDQPDEIMDEADFHAVINSVEGWDEALARAVTGTPYDNVEAVVRVVDTIWAGNNWEEAVDGAGYLEALRRSGAGDVADRLVGEWQPEAERVLAGLYQRHAPDLWNSRIAAGAGDAARLGKEALPVAGKALPESTEIGDMVAHLTNAEYQWQRWDRQRGVIDPHMTMTDGVEKVPRFPDQYVSEALDLERGMGLIGEKPLSGLMADPRVTAKFQMEAGTVRGANVFMDDGERILVATQYADVRTGLHELAHIFFEDLDPSAVNLLLREYTKDTGLPTFGRVTRSVEEWFSDKFPEYVASAAAPVPTLNPTFEYFRKWLGAVYTTIQKAEEGTAFKTAKAEAIREAREVTGKARADLNAAEQALGKSQRKVKTAADALRKRRNQTGIDKLDAKAAAATESATKAGERVKPLKSAKRAADDELKRTRAKRPDVEEMVAPEVSPEAEAAARAEWEAEAVRLRTESDDALRAANIEREDMFIEDEAKPGQMLAEKWRGKEDANGRPVRNSRAVEKELEKMEAEGAEVGDALDSLSDYNGMERSDFTDAEEWADARTEAWEDVLDKIEEIESRLGREAPSVEIAPTGVIHFRSGDPDDFDWTMNPVGNGMYTIKHGRKVEDALVGWDDSKAFIQSKTGVSDAQWDAARPPKIEPFVAPTGEPVLRKTKHPDVLAAEERARIASRNLASAQRELATVRKARNSATASARAAKRRTPITKFEDDLRKAHEAHDEAVGKYREAKAALDDAERTRARVSAQRQPKTKWKSEMSPEMKGLFNDALQPRKPVKAPVRREITGEHYDGERERLYGAMEQAFLRSEDRAQTLHYYKRGRSWLERSANHPYLGLYPLSYMWGKMLPEVANFLLVSPFGIPAPGAGLMASQHIYRGVMLQKEYDEDFRKALADNEPLFRFISMMMPALPWEVPVNAPLWARRTAEYEMTQQQRENEGVLTPVRDEQGNIVDYVSRKPMGAQQFGNIAADVASYAFGPAYGIKSFGQAVGAIGDISEGLGATINDSLSDVFAPAVSEPWRPTLP